MDQKEVCFQVCETFFLQLCSQLHKQGINVVAVNTFVKTPLIWVVNSPLLQNFLLPIQNYDFRLNGVDVTLLPNKHRGTAFRKFKNISYFDLVQKCEKEMPRAWSSPCCLDKVKIMYR